jgi:hypothetical protein
VKNVLLLYGTLGLLVAGVGVFFYRKIAAGVAAGAINPANPDNIVNQGVTSIVQEATGDKNQTLGGLIFDWLNPDAGLAPGEKLIAPGVIQPVAPSATPAASPNVFDSYIGLGA